MDFTTFFPSDNKDWTILVVRFSGGLPCRIEEAGNRTPSFLIPSRERLDILEFMEDQPQHVEKRSESKWTVFGIPPPLKYRGENRYRTFLSCMKMALKSCQHEWSRLSLLELQKKPRIKDLYKHHFKNNLITHQAVYDYVRSGLRRKPKPQSFNRPSLKKRNQDIIFDQQLLSRTPQRQAVMQCNNQSYLFTDSHRT